MQTGNRWLVVVGGVLMNLSLGAFYGWSLYVPSLEKALHVTRTEVSNIFSIAVVVFAITFLIGGRLQDKKGPYIVSMLGSIIFSLGFFLTSHASSLMEMYLAYGVVVGIGTGFGYVPPIGVISKWFPDRRGLVVGIAVGAFGAGSALLGPFIPGWIAAYGWQSVLMWQGIVYFIATMTAAQLMKNPPTGYVPAGWTPPVVAAGGVKPADYTPSEMLRTSQFYRLLIGYAFGISAGLLVISQLLPFAQLSITGMSAALAGTAITIAAISNAAGRILSGWLSDSIGRIRTISIMVLLSAVTLPVLGRIDSLWLFWPLLFIIYYCYGTQLSLYATTTADFFGAKNVGANYGFVFLAFGVAGVVGPRLGGVLFDQFKSYTRAFDIAAVLLVIALVIIATLKPPRK
ncbi:MAG: MFS transporter [Acidobacteria bacterium]|nr:MFS transporter [Acidobacteriota bacterium]